MIPRLLLPTLLLSALCTQGNAQSCDDYKDIPITVPEPVQGNFYNLTHITGTTVSLSSVSAPTYSFSYSATSHQVSVQKPVPVGDVLLEFTCTPSTGKIFTISLTVTDVNNKLPTWKVGSTLQNSTSASVNEGPATVGNTLPSSTDPEKPRCLGNDDISVTNMTLQIVTGPYSDKFKLKDPSGNSLVVVVKSELNYEATKSINLVVRCIDRTKTGVLVGTADFTFTINILNVVEKGSYAFQHSSYKAQLRANFTAGFVIPVTPNDINATNAMADVSTTPSYSVRLVDTEIASFVTIDNATGQLSLAKDHPPPRESAYTGTLSVAVLEDSSAKVGTATLRIFVLPAVDVPPQFTPSSLEPLSLPETAQSGRTSLPIRTVSVKYAEIAGSTPPSRSIAFSVITHNDSFGFFGCEKSSCNLRLIRKLDFEAGDKSFILNISVFDGVTVPVSGAIVVTVGDENDNTPRFRPEKFVFSNTPRQKDTIIGRVTATDADKGALIRYAINDTSFFRINAVNGSIRFNIDPNKLNDPEYSFTVRASDGKNTGVAVVTVKFGVVVAAANVMLYAVSALGGALGLILIVALISCCWMRRNAAARRDKSLPVEVPHSNSLYSYGVGGMTTLQENPVFTDVYGEEDGLELDLYKGDRAVGELRLNDGGMLAEQSTVGGSIRTVMSGTSSFLGNSHNRLVPNGNSIKLSTNSMELVAADFVGAANWRLGRRPNAVCGSPIDAAEPEGKDELTIYY